MAQEHACCIAGAVRRTPACGTAADLPTTSSGLRSSCTTTVAVMLPHDLDSREKDVLDEQWKSKRCACCAHQLSMSTDAAADAGFSQPMLGRRACGSCAACLPGLEHAVPEPCTLWAPCWMRARAVAGRGCPEVRWAVQGAAPVTCLLLRGSSCSGFTSLCSKSHCCCTISGCKAARELQWQGFWPAQMGQPVLL